MRLCPIFGMLLIGGAAAYCQTVMTVMTVRNGRARHDGLLTRIKILLSQLAKSRQVS